MLKKNDFLIYIAKRLYYLLKPNETMNDSMIVSFILSLLDTFNQRNKTFIKISKSETDFTQWNNCVMNIKWNLVFLS